MIGLQKYIKSFNWGTAVTVFSKSGSGKGGENL